MVECYLYDIIKMRGLLCLNAPYNILKNGRSNISECPLYDIIGTRD